MTYRDFIIQPLMGSKVFEVTEGICDRTTAEMSETKTTDFIQQTLIKHLSKKIQLFLNTNEFCKYHRF